MSRGFHHNMLCQDRMRFRTILFDKALLFDGGSISRTDLYVNEILAIKCGVRCR